MEQNISEEEKMRKPKRCPCSICRGKLVDRHLWNRHVQLLARGVLEDWQPLDEEAAPLQLDLLDVEQELGQAAAEEELEQSTMSSYAKEIVELVARKRVSATGAEAMLRSTHRYYAHKLPDEDDYPPSFYIAKKLALEGRTAAFFTRDFCPICDFLFPVDWGSCSRRTC